MMSLLQVEDPEFALTQLCLTSTRGELGKLPVDQLFKVESGDFYSWYIFISIEICFIYGIYFCFLIYMAGLNVISWVGKAESYIVGHKEIN